jgi:DNA-binding MarR family transcriptional regulator
MDRISLSCMHADQASENTGADFMAAALAATQPLDPETVRSAIPPDNSITQLREVARRLEGLVNRLETRFETHVSHPASEPFTGGELPKPSVNEWPGRISRPPLPDPRLLRQIIRQRQMRSQFFGSDLFADPAWGILLDLAAARAEHHRVSVTSLCIASGVPTTTGLRWITQLTEGGWLQRIEDDTDRRRAFIALTDRAADAMARLFAELGSRGSRLV